MNNTGLGTPKMTECDHKIASIFYVMVKNKCAYDETKVGLDKQELLEK